jgi:anaerobic magnesium-protoporphyrin IX monomethyl ester cyclase
MDILLIDPPYRSLKDMPTDSGYNIGLTSLAAYLHNEGVEAAILTGDLLIDLPTTNKYLSMNLKKYAAGQRKYEIIVNDKTHLVWKKLADVVRQTRPMAVGISYFTPLKHVVERVAKLIREIDQDIKIIAGSFHPTFCPEEVMRNPDIDFVIRGEGEIPLLSLVKELKKDSPKWETVPSIHYRDSDGQIRNNPGANLIERLDELPFPARNLVLNCDYNIYRCHSISTARGCPYTCTFCADRRLWGGKVRRRSVDNVIEELKLLKDTYKIDYVDFVDGTFTFDKKYLHAFCNAMIDYKLNIEWRCTARYDNLNEELLQLMKKANCSGLYLGLESGSDRVLKAIDKKITAEQIITVSKMVYNSGIPSATSIMMGLPDEGKEDIEETLKVMKKVKTDIFDINSYIPLPGTPLYDSISKEVKENIDWRKVGYKSFDSYLSKSISPDDFRRYRSEAYKIANNVRNKTLVRFGVKAVFRSAAKTFKKSRNGLLYRYRTAS